MLFEYYAFLTFEYLVKSWFRCFSSFRIILILTAQNNKGGWKPRWRQYEYSRCSVEWIELLFFSFKSTRVNHYTNLWKLVMKNKSPWIQTFCFFFLGFFLSLQDICYITISNSIFYDHMYTEWCLLINMFWFHVSLLMYCSIFFFIR